MNISYRPEWNAQVNIFKANNKDTNSNTRRQLLYGQSSVTLSKTEYRIIFGLFIPVYDWIHEQFEHIFPREKRKGFMLADVNLIRRIIIYDGKFALLQHFKNYEFSYSDFYQTQLVISGIKKKLLEYIEKSTFIHVTCVTLTFTWLSRVIHVT